MDTYYDYTNARCLPILVFLTEEEWERAEQLMDNRKMLAIQIDRHKLSDEGDDINPNAEMTNRFLRWLFKFPPVDRETFTWTTEKSDDGIYISKKEIVDEILKKHRDFGRKACKGMKE